MQISTPAKRYATALFHAAQEGKATAAIHAQLHTLQTALNEETAAALATPMSRTQRSQLASTLAKGLGAHVVLENALALLAQANRLALLPQIAAAFREQADAAAGVMSAQVQTATPLTAAQITSLKTHLKASTKAKDVDITTTLRPSLIGGFRVFFGGKVWDESVQGHLEALKERLRTTLSSHQRPNF